MSNMTTQHDDMLYDNSLNRSPSNANARGYSVAGLNRQQSRHFEYPPQHQASLYPSDSLRFDTRSDRLPAPQLYNNSYNHNPYEWSNTYAATANAATMGASSRMRPSNRRAPLPAGWGDSGPALSQTYIPSNQYAPMPSQHMAPYSNGYNDAHPGQSVGQGGNSPSMGGDMEEELIPTAIVIKNIPFAVKKEALQEIMASMGLPVPYAFNYHFDNGVFRGLAFANFSSADDTATIIEAMNHLDLHGRKLRVEYKKMLPIQERERIEREKRERRGQLEEQHRPQAMTLQTQTSLSSLSGQMIPRTSPSPVSTRGQSATHPVMKDVNMNDPQTLDYYSQLIKFKDGREQYIIFQAPIPPANRKILHALSHYLGLHHISSGEGDERYVQILREKPTTAPKSLLNAQMYDERRALARAATVDFSEIRPNESSYYSNLRNQASGYLDIPGSPGGDNSINRAGGLRGAKSFGDLQARTSSPALSTSSFPAGLTQNVTRFASEYNGMNGGQTGDLASTGQAHRGQDDSFINGFGNISLYDRTLGPTRSNGRLGAMNNNDNQGSTSGPIGSHRPINGTNNSYDESRSGSSVVPERQPRVPPNTDWRGFPRGRQNGHTGRGSDDLTPQLDEAWRRE